MTKKITFNKKGGQSYGISTHGLELIVRTRKDTPDIPLFTNIGALLGRWFTDSDIEKIILDFEAILQKGDNIEIRSFKNRGADINLLNGSPDCIWSVKLTEMVVDETMLEYCNINAKRDYGDEEVLLKRIEIGQLFVFDDFDRLHKKVSETEMSELFPNGAWCTPVTIDEVLLNKLVTEVYILKTTT